MAAHNELGKEGEEAAAAYLERNGYVVLHRNWRLNHLELDIVAAKDNELFIVEVKTRNDERFQHPADAVKRSKRRNILAAADAYLKAFDLFMPVHFDIIAVVGNNGEYEIEHICDAFSPFSN